MCLIDLTLLPMPSPRKSEIGLDNVKPASPPITKTFRLPYLVSVLAASNGRHAPPALVPLFVPLSYTHTCLRNMSNLRKYVHHKTRLNVGMKT